MSKQNNRIAAIGLTILGGAGVWLVVHRLRASGFHWSKFTALLGQMDLGWLGAAIFFILLTYLGRALRWEVLLRPVRPRPNRWGLISATLIGFTAVVVFGRAGELVRPYLIASREKVPFSSQLAAWVLERLYDLLVVLALFGYALMTVDRSDLSFGPHAAYLLQVGGEVVVVAAVLCLTALILSQQLSKRVEPIANRLTGRLPEHLRSRTQQKIHNFLHGLASTGQNQAVFTLTLYTVAEWALIALSYYCLFQGFPATEGFRVADIVLFVAFVSFGSIVQLPGVGGGMQLAAVVILTEFFSISIEAATGMALLLWLITFVLIVPIGFACALREGITWRKLKQIEEESTA
jgi:uncharacterized protein (TIRG00374 family)